MNRTARIYSAVERILSLVGLVVALPAVAGLAAAILLEDGSPVLFGQMRIGRNGRPFRLWKLRSMRQDPAGARITAGADPRITRVGRLIRKYKLDELPQLWNVAAGEMSLIGPRPELPAFVDLADPVWREVLSVRPGISDLATLVYRNEEELLRGADDPEKHYRTVILPEKLSLNVSYLRRRTVWSDLRLVLMTIRYSFLPSGFRAESIRQAFSG